MVVDRGIWLVHMVQLIFLVKKEKAAFVAYFSSVNRALVRRVSFL